MQKLGVPKGIYFDPAQDKFIPVVSRLAGGWP